MVEYVDVSFGPTDHLNPQLGYQLKIVNARNGAELLFTSRHPVTGDDLTAATCIEVVAMYLPKATS